MMQFCLSPLMLILPFHGFMQVSYETTNIFLSNSQWEWCCYRMFPLKQHGKSMQSFKPLDAHLRWRRRCRSKTIAIANGYLIFSMLWAHVPRARGFSDISSILPMYGVVKIQQNVNLLYLLPSSVLYRDIYVTCHETSYGTLVF